MEWWSDWIIVSATRCSDLITCEDCTSHPACGWCNHPSNTGLGKCVEGSASGAMTRNITTGKYYLDAEVCKVERWHFIECPRKLHSIWPDTCWIEGKWMKLVDFSLFDKEIISMYIYLYNIYVFCSLFFWQWVCSRKKEFATFFPSRGDRNSQGKQKHFWHLPSQQVNLFLSISRRAALLY